MLLEAKLKSEKDTNKMIQNKLKTFKDKVQKQFPMPPITHKVDLLDCFNKDWTSPSFYTGIRGYKMCLKVSVGKDTPLCIKIQMMSGEFDQELKWGCDFDAEVEIEVIKNGFHLVQNNKAIILQSHANCNSVLQKGGQSVIAPNLIYSFVKNNQIELRITYAGPRRAFNQGIRL